MLPNKYVRELTDVLLEEFQEQKPRIIEEVKTFSKSNLNYRLLELNDSLVLCLNKEKIDSKMHIGFPFPVYDLPDEIETSEGVSANLFLRGEPVRARQRAELFKLGQVKKFSEIKYIRDKVQKDFQNAKSLVYVDPYNFIGDSFIGLYYPDSFVKKFKIKDNDVEVFTNSHEHLAVEYEIKPKCIDEVLKSMRKNKYCVISDPLDTTWEFTYELLNSLDCDANIVIPGRNLYVTRKNGEVNIYWCEQQDVLLKNSNIEDYMQETLEPFIKKQSAKITELRRNTGKIYVNPFGSRAQKTIPVELVALICEKLKNERVDCVLIGGFPNKIEHKEWMSNFKKYVNSEIKYYSNLNELKTDLEQNRCSCLITADTSITHLANRNGYPNVTIYREELWDKKSLQSMSSDSPLDFADMFHIIFLSC